MRAAPLRPRGARPPSPGTPRGAVSAALGWGERGEGPQNPAARGPGCRWRGQAGREPGGPSGMATQILEAGVHFVLFRFYSKWPRVRGAGSAHPEVAPPTRAKGRPPPAERRRPAARGELKFKCDPRRGRELATAREGPRAQEASAFKGPARPGLACLRVRPRRRAASSYLRREVPPNLASPKVQGL